MASVYTPKVGGHYLGDPLFEPILAELSRRRTIVFVHPHEPAEGGPSKLHHPHSYIEYLFETTRVAANLLVTGSLDRHPEVSFILPHGGAAVPAHAWRLAIGLHAKQMPLVDKLVHTAERVTRVYIRDVLDEGTGGLELLRTRFFYDTALAATPFALGALQALVGPDRILFGSDVPYAPEFIVAETIRGIENHARLDEDAWDDVTRRNILKLFPAVAGRLGSSTHYQSREAAI